MNVMTRWVSIATAEGRVARTDLGPANGNRFWVPFSVACGERETPMAVTMGSNECIDRSNIVSLARTRVLVRVSRNAIEYAQIEIEEVTDVNLSSNCVRLHSPSGKGGSGMGMGCRTHQIDHVGTLSKVARVFAS